MQAANFFIKYISTKIVRVSKLPDELKDLFVMNAFQKLVSWKLDLTQMLAV